MAEVARLNEASPDRITKRRIHDEIVGNWDEHAGRYMGSATDKTIADVLKVPRAWVAEIRADYFGDDGTNEELVGFKADLERSIAEVTTLSNNALDVASKYDKVAENLKTMRQRLERIEKATLPRG